MKWMTLTIAPFLEGSSYNKNSLPYSNPKKS